jgi:predicted nucleic acid-binding Zn finger protein
LKKDCAYELLTIWHKSREKQLNVNVQNGLQMNLKRHSFWPSGRSLWTTIGNTYESWIDLDLTYCTCNDYFFRTLSGKGPCYHLTSALDYLRHGNFEEIVFGDEEYNDFIAALIADCLVKLKIPKY